MPKCNINKVAKQLESHFGMGVSFKFAAYFQNNCFLEHAWMPASVYNEPHSYPVNNNNNNNNNNHHINQLFNKDRSSYSRCSVKKGVLRHFANFTEKHLCQSLFFNKVAGLGRPQACNFVKKETLAQVFSVNFAKFLRTPFLQNTSGGLLLQKNQFLFITYEIYVF